MNIQVPNEQEGQAISQGQSSTSIIRGGATRPRSLKQRTARYRQTAEAIVAMWATEHCLNDNHQVQTNNRGDRGWAATPGPCKLPIKLAARSRRTAGAAIAVVRRKTAYIIIKISLRQSRKFKKYTLQYFYLNKNYLMAYPMQSVQ